MNKLIMVLSVCLLLCSTSYGDEGIKSMDGSGHHKFSERHEKFRLTKEQRQKMREAFFKYKENKIHLEEAVKLARLNYEKLVTDPSSDYKAAQAAAQGIADGVGKLVAAKLALKAQISFQILTEEQRKERMFMRHWNHRKGVHHRNDKDRRVAEESSQNDDLVSGPMISMEDL